MNVLSYFVAFAAGMALNAAYNYFSRDAEYRAYRKGLRHAREEEKLRQPSHKKGRLYRNYAFDTPIAKPKIEKKDNKIVIPESFMDELKKNGRAVIKLR